ncbi:MAG: hypothetical protein ABW088_16545 [Sedimenticola sp.]
MRYHARNFSTDGVRRSCLRKSLALGLLTSLSTVSAEPGKKFQACTDYHCDIVKPVSLSPPQWEQVRQKLRHKISPHDEREQIRQAVALLETLVGNQVGTRGDLARNNGEGSHPGQLDCIAESLNTTTYLKLMEDDGLLQWHQVLERKKRSIGFFAVHWTAVIREKASRQKYAVDSWFLENGKPPVIQTIEEWKKRSDF